MSWSQIYLNYDQDALAVYANVGVIRRALKDIEANKVKLIEHNQSHLIFEVDNQQVKLTPQGIQAAKCSCPASDHCKHIIASVLWLHENPLIDESKVTPNCDTLNQPLESSKSHSDPLAELLAIESSQLFKTVGKANIRLAYQLLFDWLQSDAVTVQTQGVQLRNYQTTLARSNKADINFNQYSIWHRISLWQSMPNILMRKRFSLNNPLLAEGNNLSSTGASVVIKSIGWTDLDYQEFRAFNGFRNWKELSRYLENSDVSDGLFDQVIAIHITNTQKPVLDEIKQSLIWCIKDNKNNDLLLQLFWDGNYSQRIDTLNLLLRTAHQPLTVLVKCIKNDSNLDLEPFAIIYKESKTDQINIANLDFDYEWLYPKGKNYKAFEASKEPVLKKQMTQINYQQDPIATYIIKPTLALLEAITSSGRLILSNADKQKINQLQYQCDTLGLTTLSHTLNKLAQNQPIEIKHILQTAYLCQLMNNTHYQLPIVIREDET